MVDSSGVNWGLGVPQGSPADASNTFMQAYQQSRQQSQQDQAKQAMAALVQNPSDPQALAALAKVDPNAAMQFRQQQIEYSKAQLAQHQDSILKGAEIIRQVQPQDQASWTRALAIAQQAGVDVSQVPQQYNKEYADGVVALADAFKPQTSNMDKFIPLQPGGSVAKVDPRTGQVQMVVLPNEGGQQAGAPAQGGPPPEAVARLKANPQEAQQFDEIFGPGSSQRALGGQPVAPAGGFPGRY